MVVTVWDETQFRVGELIPYKDLERVYSWECVCHVVPPQTPPIIHNVTGLPYQRRERVQRIVENLVGRRSCTAIIVHPSFRVMSDTEEFYLNVPVSIKLCNMYGALLQ